MLAVALKILVNGKQSMCDAAGSLLKGILGQVSASQFPPWTISSGPIFVLKIAAVGRPFSASLGLPFGFRDQSNQAIVLHFLRIGEAMSWLPLFHSSGAEPLQKRGWDSLAQVKSGPQPHWHLAVSKAVSSQLSFAGWSPLGTPATGQDYGVTPAVRL